jgi:hypothetical protein
MTIPFVKHVWYWEKIVFGVFVNSIFVMLKIMGQLLRIVFKNYRFFVVLFIAIFLPYVLMILLIVIDVQKTLIWSESFKNITTYTERIFMYNSLISGEAILLFFLDLSTLYQSIFVVGILLVALASLIFLPLFFVK